MLLGKSWVCSCCSLGSFWVPGSIGRSIWFSLYSPQRFAAVKWGYRVASALGLVKGRGKYSFSPFHTLLSLTILRRVGHLASIGRLKELGFLVM